MRAECLRRCVRRIALIVNPDAGLGGRLGLKGSDGQAAIAREMGAEDRSGPRMVEALEHLLVLSEHTRTSILDVEWLTCDGRMGLDWVPEGLREWGGWEVMHTPTGPVTTASDTTSVVRAALDEGCEAILYAGGDGTTRDVVAALAAAESDGVEGASEMPLIGVPAGVKMHSGCFGATPAAAAEALAAWITGDLLMARTEVMDLDEDRYREGEWVVRRYGEAMTPGSPRWMQGTKQPIEAGSEEEVIEALVEHLGEWSEEDPARLFIWGSGGTLRTLAEALGLDATLLGLDASRGGATIATDLDERGLLDLIAKHRQERGETAPVTILLSPMGGQGFLIGRGNLQLSPAVLRTAGLDSVLGIVTPAKMASLAHLRIDSGDRALDEEFREQRYVRALQGYRTTRLVRVAES